MEYHGKNGICIDSHAGFDDLVRFSKAINPKHFVPIHSFEWDDHTHEFENVLRLKDGERWEVN